VNRSDKQTGSGDSMTSTSESTLIVGAADIYDQKVDRFLDSATVKALSKIKPWRGLLQVGLEWLAIAAAIVLCQTYWHPALHLRCDLDWCSAKWSRGDDA